MAFPHDALLTHDPPPAYAARRPVRTADGVLDITIDHPTIRATVVATGDVYELAVDDELALRVCPRVGDAAGLLALVERAAAVAVQLTAPPTDGRLRAVYELRAGVARLSLVVRPADPVLDAQYGATIELPLVRRASEADALASLRRDMRAENEVLAVVDGRLTRVHASDLDDRTPWTVVAPAPVRLTRDLVVETDVDDLSAVRELAFLRTARLARVVDLEGLAACRHLRSVDVSSDRLVCVAPLARLPVLEDVRLRGCVLLVDASALTACAALTALDVSGCVRLARLPGPPSLRRLVARGCTALSDLSPLTATAVWHGTVLASAPRDHVPEYNPFREWRVDAAGRHMICPADLRGIDHFFGANARPPTAVIEAALQSAHVQNVLVGFAHGPPLDQRGQPLADKPSIGTSYPEVCLRIKLQSIQPANGWPHLMGQADGPSPGGPELVGRLTNVTVDLVDSAVTRDHLKVMCTWYESLIEHGAVVRLHDLHVSPSQNRPHYVLPDWVDAVAAPVANTELFLPPANRDDYLVDVWPAAGWHYRQINC